MKSRQVARRLAAFSAAGALLIGTCATAQAASKSSRVVAGAVAVGSVKCLDCHDEISHAIGSHRRAFVAAPAGLGCESCHGPGSVHAESNEKKDILGKEDLASLDASGRSAACLSCHGKRMAKWKGTEHAAADVSCWDCHRDQLHFVSEAEKSFVRQSPGRCAACHANVESEFRLQYRHPVAAGKLSCLSCHDLHAEGRVGFRVKSGTAECVSCHTSVAGPWVFEHDALEEGCTTCHRPHGSVNRRLLTESGNALCLKCHAQSDFPAVGKRVHNYPLAAGGLCTDCHLQVHGSNTDANLNPRFR